MPFTARRRERYFWARSEGCLVDDAAAGGEVLIGEVAVLDGLVGLLGECERLEGCFMDDAAIAEGDGAIGAVDWEGGGVGVFDGLVRFFGSCERSDGLFADDAAGGGEGSTDAVDGGIGEIAVFDGLVRLLGSYDVALPKLLVL